MIDRILAKFFNLLIILVGIFLIMFGLLSIQPSASASPAPEIPAGFSMEPEEIAAWQATQEAIHGNIPLLLPAPLPEDLPPESVPAEAPAAEQLFTASEAAPIDPSGTGQTAAINPDRIVIESIQLDAPVLPAVPRYISIHGQSLRLWDVPEGFLAGWHGDSAGMGQVGNMVLNGHHNIYGQVFARLIDLEVGAEIRLYGDNQVARYLVTEKVLLPEKDQPLDVRLMNASFIRPTADTRLTLVTCWPFQTNTHRLIVIATPVEG
jgi:LPXTG-site transpeptidase (sortase) family protein